MTPSTQENRLRGPVLLLALIWPSIISLLDFVIFRDNPTGIGQVCFVVGKILQFLLPVWWVAAIERRRPRWEGKRTAGLGIGLVFGLVVAGAGVALYYALIKPEGYLDLAHAKITEQIDHFHINTPVRYIALGVFYSAVHSLLEEYYWRWFVFGRLKKLMEVWPAIIVSSLGFTAHHVIVLGSFFGFNNPLTYVFSAGVTVGGLVWAWLYNRSGSLLGPWLSHALVDAGIFLIGYDMVFGR